jgi:hypothetical protein
MTVIYEGRSARMPDCEGWRETIAKQLGFEGFIWRTRESGSNWMDGQFPAIPSMEIRKGGTVYRVEIENQNSKEAIMRDRETGAAGWSLWKDDKKVEEEDWKIDRYVWKSDTVSWEVTVDDKEVELANRSDIQKWLEEEYPGERIVDLSQMGRKVNFGQIQSGNAYWTISEEDDRLWQWRIEGRAQEFAYRPSYMELSELSKVRELWDKDTGDRIPIEEVLEGGVYTMSPRRNHRLSYQKPSYQKPECRIWIVKEHEKKEFDTSSPLLLTEISHWIQKSVDGRKFKDIETEEVLPWRALRNGRRYRAAGQRSAPLKIKAGNS